MNSSSSSECEQPDWLRLVRQQVDNTRFGVVQIVIHDRRVVQVETTEKVRLDHETKPSADGSRPAAGPKSVEPERQTFRAS